MLDQVGLLPNSEPKPKRRPNMTIGKQQQKKSDVARLPIPDVMGNGLAIPASDLLDPSPMRKDKFSRQAPPEAADNKIEVQPPNREKKRTRKMKKSSNV